MLAKPFIFFFTFILTMANFIFLLLPISVICFPLFIIFSSFFANTSGDLVMMFFAIISCMTVIYMLGDLFFGFTARRLNKGAKKFEEMTAVPRHQEIMRDFERLKGVFGVNDAKLFLDPNGNLVNAYAIGSAFNKNVTLTMGLIFDIHRKCNNEDRYVAAISAVLGHELSHLANKDYLPGLLASSSETANYHVSQLVRIILLGFANIFRLIPVIGVYIRNMIYKFYNFVNWLSNLFFKVIFRPVYGFVQKWFGRSIEYRCDRDASKVVGGHAMAWALEALGKGAYFSIFSTHPRTKSRIKHIKDTRPTGQKMKSGLINDLANVASIIVMLVVTYNAVTYTNWKKIDHNFTKQVYKPAKKTVAVWSANIKSMF